MVSNIKECWFFRCSTQTELSHANLVYFIDGQEYGTINNSCSNMIHKLEIPTENLSTGIHSIDMAIILPNGIATTIISSWFYKTPIPPGVVRYEYWFNEDYDNNENITLERNAPNFQLIKMLDVPELPFSSQNYAFSIINSQPTISNIQSLSMRFFESDGRPVFQQTEFIDSRSERQITDIQLLAEGTNKVASIENQEIKWFCFDGEIGDSIALKTDCAAMFELYSPSGHTILKKKGSHTEALSTATLSETGTYYFAIHDIMGSTRKDIEINFQHIPRNAILEIRPAITTNTSLFTLIELFGNGMSSAKKLVLKNDTGSHYETESVTAVDNYHLNATFSSEHHISTGIYDVVLTFDDNVSGTEQCVIKEAAITVLDANSRSNIEIEVVPSKRAGTPYMVDVNVTNNSDVPCWGIPVNIACERDGGKNGFIFYMRDFLTGSQMTAGNIQLYETDNILGSGVDGVYFPIILDYLQPQETRTLRTGIISEPHAHVGFYAWAGEPYNEEIARLIATPIDSLGSRPLIQTNIFSFQTQAYLSYILSEITEEQWDQQIEPKRMKPSADDNTVLENIREYAPDAIGRYQPLRQPANFADRIGHLAVAIGQTFAGLVNLGPCQNASQYFIDNGIPGSTLREQLNNIDLMYGENMPADLRIHYDNAKRNLARLVPPEDILNEAGYPVAGDAVNLFMGRCASSSNPSATRHDIYCLQSGDPNILTGYSDPSGGNFVGIDIHQLGYSIEFENDPNIATAPASSIIVTTTLDGNVFDLDSFTPDCLKLGSHYIDLPNEHSFVRTIDLRPDIQCIAEIRFEYLAESGEAKWIFRSLDPMTLEAVDNFRQGLLPVNDSSGKGLGFIDYTIKLRDNLEHALNFSNYATITFDSNDPIVTPVWTNTTDYERPKAEIVKEYGYENMAYGFDVEVSDIGSGVFYYDLYARTSSSDNWTVVLSGLTDSHIEFATPEHIEDIQFMVRATDCAGNRQLNNGILSSIEPIEPADENTRIKEIWYDLQGNPRDPEDRNSHPIIIISTTGKKILVR